MRGYLAELMAKSVDSDMLDAALTAADKQALLEFLSIDGNLTGDLSYTSSDRRGFTTFPAAGTQAGVVADPHAFGSRSSWGLLHLHDPATGSPGDRLPTFRPR